MSMPTLPTGLQDLSIDGGVEPTRFPAPSKQAAGSVNGTQTDVSSVYFADKILITISQGGRLSQWVYPPDTHSQTVLTCLADPSTTLIRLPHRI
jgi:proteasome assembly chaperone 3